MDRRNVEQSYSRTRSMIIIDKSGPWRVWCHICNIGFSSIEESQQHDKESLNKHRNISQSKKEVQSVPSR